MAKGNLFLGTGRRRVGDVVLYRRNGQQIARAYVAKVSNPKTSGQANQRAAFAPVTKFYSPLATCLEQSFEGLTKSASVNKFQSVNIALAKKNSWLLPKGTDFFPLPYKLSGGSRIPFSYVCNAANGFAIFVNGLTASENPTIGQISTDLINAGIMAAGEQVTIILVLRDQTGDFIPRYVRFIVNTSDARTAQSVLGTALQCGVVYDNLGWRFTEVDLDVVAGAAISSAYVNNAWRRSPQFLAVREDIMKEVAAGIYGAMASYQDSEGSNESNVYLNGSKSLFLYDSGGNYRIDSIRPITITVGEASQQYVIGLGASANGDTQAFRFYNSADFQGQEGAFMQPTGWGMIDERTLGDAIRAETGLSLVTIPISDGDTHLMMWLMAQGIPASVFTLGTTTE